MVQNGSGLFIGNGIRGPGGSAVGGGSILRTAGPSRWRRRRRRRQRRPRVASLHGTGVVLESYEGEKNLRIKPLPKKRALGIKKIQFDPPFTRKVVGCKHPTIRPPRRKNVDFRGKKTIFHSKKACAPTLAGSILRQCKI